MGRYQNPSVLVPWWSVLDTSSIPVLVPITRSLYPVTRIRYWHYFSVPILVISTNIWCRFTRHLTREINSIHIPIFKMYIGITSRCLPPIVIEIIIVRHQRERVLKFTADCDCWQLNSPKCSINNLIKPNLLWWVSVPFTIDYDWCYRNSPPAIAQWVGFCFYRQWWSIST